MRRAGRIIYNGAMVVSLLLSLLTVGVWVRSYWVSDFLFWYEWPDDRSCLRVNAMGSSRGGLQLTFDETQGRSWLLVNEGHFHHLSPDAVSYPQFRSVEFSSLTLTYSRYAALGFEWVPEAKGESTMSPQQSYTVSSLTLPLYFPCLLFALLPAHYFLRVRGRRRVAGRRARGCCVICGYDLRASAGRCPECGREAAAVQ